MSKRSLPRRFGGVLLLSGLMILLLGLYYLAVRAGLPYQDPTPETQFQYAINHGVGMALAKLGAVLAAVGFLLKLLFKTKK